jgi:hypothetical protein
MTQTAQPTHRSLPIYATYSTYERAMDHFQQHGLPPTLTVKTVRAVPEDTARRLIAGFRAVGWIDDAGIPSAELRALTKARNMPEWQETLRSVLRNVYSFLPAEWEKLTSEELSAAFRKYAGRDADALKGAQTFFLAAALDAGVQLPTELALRASKARNDTSHNFRFRKGDINPAQATEQKNPAARTNGTVQSEPDTDVAQVWNLVGLIDDNTDMTDKEKNAVFTLLAYLKRRAQRRQGGRR